MEGNLKDALEKLETLEKECLQTKKSAKETQDALGTSPPGLCP
jgi:hypothetical protein